MPRVTQAHLDARRQQILTAAHRCFARRGLHETKMQEIAREAGLSAGALYRYFDGKQALIEALAEWGRELRQEALGDLRPGGGAETLARVIGAMLKPLTANSAETDAALQLDVRLWSEALDQPSIRRLSRKQLAALRNPVADYLRGERKAGRVRRDIDPEAAAHVVVALLIGLALQKALDPQLDVPRYTATLEVLLQALATPESNR